MIDVRKAGWWVLVSLCAASGLAQDVPDYENPYAPKKKPKGPVAAVDAGFAKLLTGRISACYQAEQGKALTPEDRTLLESYAKDVARELAPAFVSSNCHLDKPASSRCGKELEALPCERLAQPIIAAGWDRHLTPEAKAQVAQYAQALARREGACSDRDGEEAAIVGEVEVDKLSLLIEMEIVTGKCELIPAELRDCEKELKGMSCGNLAQRKDRGELTQACGELFRCRELKVDTDVPL